MSGTQPEANRLLTGQIKVNAVKAYRVANGSTLREAVDAVEAGWRPTQPEPERNGAVERVREYLSLTLRPDEWVLTENVVDGGHYAISNGDLRTVLSLLSEAKIRRDFYKHNMQAAERQRDEAHRLIDRIADDETFDGPSSCRVFRQALQSIGSGE